jgi:hypothetical protein
LNVELQALRKNTANRRIAENDWEARSEFLDANDQRSFGHGIIRAHKMVKSLFTT